MSETQGQAATPGRCMSTLAYRLLSTDRWPVYVKTSRNFTYGGGPAPEPTDPDDSLSGSDVRPVSTYNPFAHVTGEWSGVANWLDDRVTSDGYFIDEDSYSETGAYDEYFIAVESPHGGNMVTHGDYAEGSTVAESNYRSLVRDFPGVFVEVNYAYCTQTLMIPVMVPSTPTDEDTAHYDPEWADGVASAIEGLLDYPLYDEEDHSELEQEKISEALNDSWNQSQIQEGVAEALRDLILADPKSKPDPEFTLDGYDYDRALEEWLDEVGDRFLTWDFGYYGDWKAAMYESVYTLYGRYQEEQGHIVFEAGSEPTFLHADDAYAATAKHIWVNRNRLGARGGLPEIPMPVSYPAEG